MGGVSENDLAQRRAGQGGSRFNVTTVIGRVVHLFGAMGEFDNGFPIELHGLSGDIDYNLEFLGFSVGNGKGFDCGGGERAGAFFHCIKDIAPLPPGASCRCIDRFIETLEIGEQFQQRVEPIVQRNLRPVIGYREAHSVECSNDPPDPRDLFFEFL